MEFTNILYELRLTMDGESLRIHGLWRGKQEKEDIFHIQNQIRDIKDLRKEANLC